MSQSGLIDIEASHPQIPTQFNADSGSAIPIANMLTIDGLTVANGTYAKPVFTTASGNTLDVNVQVGTAITGAPADTNDAGIASFDSDHFTVDANGFVQLAGGGTAVDTNTGDDGVAVGADASGNFNWLGVTVANATHAKPVYFKDSATANALDLDIQVATAVTGSPGDKNDAGLSSYDDTYFTVDADGYVSLTGGTAFFWNVITQATEPANFVVNNGYLCQSGGTGNVSIALPTTSEVGDEIAIYLDGATTWTITQGAGQQIRISGSQTTLGAGGSLTTTGTGDGVRLVCSVADTLWVCINQTGNITVA